MALFLGTLDQIAFLFSFILLGFLLMKGEAVPEHTATVLAKLENTLFIPALVMGTFLQYFTRETLGRAGVVFLAGLVVGLVGIPLAILLAKPLTKDSYLRKIYIYGLSFSNFSFMGNAVVSSLFPDLFFDYLIFTLPLWILVYLWGAPRLLIADEGEERSLGGSLRALCNPMFLSMLVGMGIGIVGIPLPAWLIRAVTVGGNCMSPIAMLLTGMAVSAISFRRTFTNLGIYAVSLARLLVIPALFLAVGTVLPLPAHIYLCTLCVLAMPLGLNTIVIPGAYGRDTTAAAGMAVVSHLLSAVTIPLLFSLAI